MLYRAPERRPFHRLAGLLLRLKPRPRRRRMDLRELSPYMRWDIGITDIGPTERGWR